MMMLIFSGNRCVQNKKMISWKFSMCTDGLNTSAFWAYFTLHTCGQTTKCKLTDTLSRF